MNGLSLRVSTIKPNSEVRKTNEYKYEPIKFELLLPTSSNEFQTFFNEFTAAPNVETQLKLLKATNLTDLPDVIKEEFLKIYCELYLSCPLKHAVRHTLAKLIDREKDTCGKSSMFLSELISRQVTDVHKIEANKVEDLNTLVNSIGACLDGFQCGIDAFHKNVNGIITYYLKILDTDLITFDDPKNSPARKNELAGFIHNLLRVMIAACQKFESDINWAAIADRIKAACETIMSHPDIPIDTKTNAGILTVLGLKNTNNLKVILKDKPRKHVHNLCISFGLVCAIEKNQEAFDWITTALKRIVVENVLEPSLVVCLCRVLLQFSRNLKVLVVDSNTAAVKLCLDYALHNIDHYMDTMRHMSKNILRNLVELDEEWVLNDLFEYVKTPTFSKTNKGVIVTSVCQVKGVGLVRQKMPNICELLINSFEDNNSHNTNSSLSHCYENLMHSELESQQDLNKWFEDYVRPLVEHLKTIPVDQCELTRSIESLILKAVKKSPKIVTNIQQSNVPTSLFMACLSAAKKTGEFDKVVSNSDSWKGVLPFSEIQNAMVSASDETRLAAFAVIVETHKTCEYFTKEEFECILHFLKYNINAQSPAIRQQITSQLRNLFIRLDSCLIVLKKIKDLTDDTNFINYHHFLTKLNDFCFDNFFQGANFGRRALTLKILIHLGTLQKKHDEYFPMNLWTKDRCRIMIQCLDDSYESNKVDAMTVLKNCPSDFLDTETITLEETIKLANSKKPANSLTAAYYLEYLTFLKINSKELSEFTEELPLYSHILKKLADELDKSLKVAEVSILEAASHSPMYGLLFCLRHILDKLDINELDYRTHWREFIERLITLSKNLCQVVGPIVNNSSPEGHLPTHPDSAINITPQMILLCAWRTIKEVSLLLGDISFRAEIGESGNGVITITQLLDIGSHFTTLLSETKHRGAFEQAYIGFSRLCVRLWSAQESELHTLPIRWLKALIKIIAGDTEIHETTLDMSVDKLCATRRSAGVPFLMQALITTELQIGTHKGLKYCMVNLIELCQKKHSTETRTHALNILRALFRCTDLGEAIAEYVSDGFICAIQGYDAETWGERNSATLLFSALMIRVFGVQRSRDSENLNVRNRMTGRIFFLRYPKLYDFFYEELQIAEEITGKGMKSLKLFSLLLLLSRLYPSALEGVESNLQLTWFIPLVSSCSGSPEFKTRQLAARIIPIFLTPDDTVTRILKIVEILQGDLSDVALNFIHGALLQLLYLVKSLPKEERVTTTKWSIGEASDNSHKSKIEEMLHEMTQLVPNLRQLPVIWITFYDVLLEIFLRIGSIQNLVLNLDTFIKPMDRDSDDIGYNILHKRLVLLKFIKVIQDPTNDSLEIFFKNLGSSLLDYEYQDAVLNVLLLILDFKQITEEADDLEISETEINIVKRFLNENESEIDGIITQIKTSETLLTCASRILKRRSHYLCTVKTYMLMGYSQKFTKKVFDRSVEDVIGAFIKMAESKTFQLRDAMYSCLAKYLETFENLEDLQCLINMVGPENSEKLRQTACQILSNLQPRIFNGLQTHTTTIYSYFWSLLTLLRDDYSSIRASASAVAMKLFNSFYSTNEPIDVIAFVAREKLFKLLHDFLTTTFANEKNKIAVVYVEILMLDRLHLEGGGSNSGEDETFFSATKEDMTRCFDKNEANIFAENFFVKLECFKQLLALEQEVEGDGDSTDLKLLIENLKEDEKLMKWIKRH